MALDMGGQTARSSSTSSPSGSRSLSAAAAVLVLAGGFVLRYVVLMSIQG